MPTSPTATRDNMRLYESYIAPSPKAHMAIKAPLGRLRRRTTELVDQITGATIQEDVKQQERDLREEKRKWRCRACKVSYAGERELNKVSISTMDCLTQLKADRFPISSPPAPAHVPVTRRSRRGSSTGPSPTRSATFCVCISANVSAYDPNRRRHEWQSVVQRGLETSPLTSEDHFRTSLDAIRRQLRPYGWSARPAARGRI